MNQVFLEERSKEKVNELLEEGLRSQEYYRNRKNRVNPLRVLLKLILAVLKAIIHLPLPKRNQPASSHQRS